MVILRAERLSKHFGALAAVTDLDLSIEEGRIHAIIGPNGAGKSTLVNMISGIYPPTSGKIIFRDKNVTGLKANVITGRGVGRTFQTVRTFKDMTALENVMVGQHCRTDLAIWSSLFRPPLQEPAREKEMRLKAEGLLERVGLAGRGSKSMAQLSLVEQRRLEIARALATEPRLLLLDEPSAGMTVRESIDLQQLIQEIAGRGTTVLFIAHDMALVMAAAQTITVLSFGSKIAEGPPQEIRRNKEVITAYLGQE